MKSSSARLGILFISSLLLASVHCSDGGGGGEPAGGGAPGAGGEAPPPVVVPPPGEGPATQPPPKPPDTAQTTQPPTVELRLLRLDGKRVLLSAKPLPLRVKIEATFSEPMDTASVEKAVSIVDAKNNRVVGSFSWSGDKKTLLLTPQSAGKDVSLKPAMAHKVTIAKSAASATKKELAAPVDQSFTTMTPGDVNGDGVADVVVGASRSDNSTGMVYLFSGKDMKPSAWADTAAFATIVGEGLNQRFGGSVAIAGDVNADGYADLIVGAEQGGGNLEGAAYLFSGSTLVGAKRAAVDALARITGVAQGDVFGFAVAGAGDVNNDGFTDVIVGAFNVNNGNGAAYVFSGAGLPGMNSADDATANITGMSPGGVFGASVAGAGDADGDGLDDVIVGAPMTDDGLPQAGMVYLFAGSSLTKTMTSNDALRQVKGNAHSDQLGISVTGVGDVDGDGREDVMVGARTDFNGQDAGAAYLYSGKDFS